MTTYKTVSQWMWSTVLDHKSQTFSPPDRGSSDLWSSSCKTTGERAVQKHSSSVLWFCCTNPYSATSRKPKTWFSSVQEIRPPLAPICVLWPDLSVMIRRRHKLLTNGVLFCCVSWLFLSQISLLQYHACQNQCLTLFLKHPPPPLPPAPQCRCESDSQVGYFQSIHRALWF